MQFVTLPGTDLGVSRICLGTGNLGSTVSREASFALLDAFAEAGGNFLDTAHVYADWIPGEKHLSEKTIGKWLKASGRRAQTIVATKGAHPDLATMSVSRMSPAEIVSDLDESLLCLDVDSIDLYWLHRDEPARPVGEILETLNAQVQAGKIRYFGCSNWQPDRIRVAHAYAAEHGLRSFVASQVYWSLATANPGLWAGDVAIMDESAHSYYAGAGMGVLAFTSQGHGFFSKADAIGIDSLKPDLRRDFANDVNLARLARVQKLARELGTSIAAVVRAYISSQPFVAVPIIGSGTMEQLHDSLTDADLTLTPESLRYLTAG